MYYILIGFIIVLTQYWSFFLKNNFFFLRTKPLFIDRLKKTNILKKLNFRNLLRFSLIINFFFLINLFFLKGEEFSFFWNHFYLSNFNLYIIYYIFFINLLCLVIIHFFSKGVVNIGIEYIFAIANINVVVLLLFFVNNLYSLVFILELVSSLIFYKFTVSKFWLNTKNKKFNKLVTTKFNKTAPKYFLNMLFFQYWSTFFSSVFILYSLINLTLVYGTTDWFFLNFLFKINQFIFYFEQKELLLICCPLFFGIIIKLGITPIHLYKIEIYKGLPFISIFLYTTYYFLVYFFFFYIFIFIYLFSYSSVIWLFLFLLLIVGLVYFLNILFDGLIIKSFFAFSTIINALNFILILISSV